MLSRNQYAFEESFCDDSNLHITLFKYVLSTMGASKESISKKNVLIDSLLTPIVESTYMNISLHSDFATLLDLMRLAVLCYTC